MTKPSKPTLFNGFQLTEDRSVKARRHQEEHGEIYQLADGKYLYLFTDLEPNQIVSEKRPLTKVSVNNKAYLGVVDDSYSINKFRGIYSDLTELTGFASVAGMDELKQMLTDEVINPLLHPEKFKKFKVSIPNGILLYGPPGCGKTFIVRKLSEELDYAFYEIKHSDVASPYIHGAVEKIAKVFDIAKSNAPAIIFIDELSGLVPNREHLGTGESHKEEEVNQFLVELNDAGENNILVVGATNYPERIDKAIMRSGRMDKKIMVPPPDFEARKSLFKIGLTGRPHEDGIDFEKLATLTEDYSSSDIVEGIVENVARRAVNQDKPAIDQQMIEEEIKNFKPIPKEEQNMGFRV